MLCKDDMSLACRLQSAQRNLTPNSSSQQGIRSPLTQISSQVAEPKPPDQSSVQQESIDVFLDRAWHNSFTHPQHHPPLSHGISSRILFQCQPHQHCHAAVAAVLAAHEVDLADVHLWPLSSLMSIDRLELGSSVALPAKLLAQLLSKHPDIKFAECDVAFQLGDRHPALHTPSASRVSWADIRQAQTGHETHQTFLRSLLSHPGGATGDQPPLDQVPHLSSSPQDAASSPALTLTAGQQAHPSESANAANASDTAAAVEAAAGKAAAEASAAAAGLAVNDPIWPAEWDRRVIGLTSRNATEDAGPLPGAWKTQTDASPVIVCITDSGIDYTHPDLAANMWTNPGEIAGNGLDDDGNGIVDDVHGYNAVDNNGDIMDADSHGTHTAGIVGAVANNGLGISGIAQKVIVIVSAYF